MGKNVLVVEDLISTGGSSLKAVAALREKGLDVLGMVAIFTYGFPLAEENFRKESVELTTLGDYNSLIDQAVKTSYVKVEFLETLKEWREDPGNWKN